MQITWLGQACFKIQGKDASIVTDPFDKKIGLNLPHLKADVVTVSHNHYDHNNIKAVSGQPFIVDTPGEFEIKKIFIWGVPSWHDDKEGAERGPNTIYVFKIENIRIAHLGDLGTKLNPEQMEKLEGVDILMIPVGGIYTINSKMAADIVNELEPRIVIPMHYKLPGLKIKLHPVDKFLDELGIKKEPAIDKLKINKKDLPADEIKVILLKP